MIDRFNIRAYILTLLPILDQIPQKLHEKKNYNKVEHVLSIKFICLFVTEEIQYHSGLRLRELGPAPILLLGRGYHLTNVNRWSDCVGYRIEIESFLRVHIKWAIDYKIFVLSTWDMKL